jgi:hypothetical protein
VEHNKESGKVPAFFTLSFYSLTAEVEIEQVDNPVSQSGIHKAKDRLASDRKGDAPRNYC